MRQAIVEENHFTYWLFLGGQSFIDKDLINATLVCALFGGNLSNAAIAQLPKFQIAANLKSPFKIKQLISVYSFKHNPIRNPVMQYSC